MSTLEDIAKVLGFPFKDSGKPPDNYKSFFKGLYIYLSGKKDYSPEKLGRILGFSFSLEGDDCKDIYNLLLKLYKFLGGNGNFRLPYSEDFMSKICHYLGGGGSGDAFHCYPGGGGIVCESYNDYVVVVAPGNGEVSNDDEVVYIRDDDVYSVVSKGLSCSRQIFDMFIGCDGAITFTCFYPKQHSFTISSNDLRKTKECNYSVHNEIASAILKLLGG